MCLGCSKAIDGRQPSWLHHWHPLTASGQVVPPTCRGDHPPFRCSPSAPCWPLNNSSVSHLHPLLQAANLTEALANPEVPLTVFAPTNEAFELALGALNVTLEGENGSDRGSKDSLSCCSAAQCSAKCDVQRNARLRLEATHAHSPPTLPPPSATCADVVANTELLTSILT